MQSIIRFLFLNFLKEVWQKPGTILKRTTNENHNLRRDPTNLLTLKSQPHGGFSGTRAKPSAGQKSAFLSSLDKPARDPTPYTHHHPILAFEAQPNMASACAPSSAVAVSPSK